MKHTLKKLFNSCKGAVDVVGVLVDVALVAALIPVIKSFIAGAEGNLTASESILLGLTTLFIIIALVANIVRQSGIARKK